VKKHENLSTIIDKVTICNAMSYFLVHPVGLYTRQKWRHVHNTSEMRMIEELVTITHKTL